MKNNTRVYSLSNGFIAIHFLILISFCFLPMNLFAGSAPLMTVEVEQDTVSSGQFIGDKSMLLKYAKELQIQSQIIAKDYFYISQGLREDKAGKEIEESARDIDRLLNTLEVSIKDPEKKNLLQYLSDIHKDSKGILKDQYSEENASQVIDYSETVYEASQSVIEHLSKKTAQEYSLHDAILQQHLLLQRISKFYIAYQVGFNDEAMLGKLTESVKSFEEGLETLRTHKFANEDQAFVYTRLEHYWSISRKFYEGMKEGELTLIVSISTDHMVSYLDKILAMEQASAQSIGLLTSSD